MELVHATKPNCLVTRPERPGSCQAFMTYLETTKPKVDARIMQYVRGDPGEATLDRRLEAALRHGKRMRAGLLMLVFDTYSEGPGTEMALDLASAVEIAHAASLIVDDMLDEDDVRHGMPALHLTAGHKCAMLGTVGLLSYPYQIASRYGEDIVMGVARTHRAMVRGAAMEMTSTPSFGVGQVYDKIIENKTGVLFSLSARYGAIAAECSEVTVDRCAEFGMLVGKAMQIADDVADLQSLLNGKATGIGGSEAILLRCCLGQTREGEEDVDREMHTSGRPIGTERRKDIEDILSRYLDAAIVDAREAAIRLAGAECGYLDGPQRADLPELRDIASEIAGMVLGERK